MPRRRTDRATLFDLAKSAIADADATANAVQLIRSTALAVGLVMLFAGLAVVPLVVLGTIAEIPIGPMAITASAMTIVGLLRVRHGRRDIRQYRDEACTDIEGPEST